MQAAGFTPGPAFGFQGIDPEGLRALARLCIDRSAALSSGAGRVAASQVAIGSTPATVGRRLEETAIHLRRWSADLATRADNIETGQRLALLASLTLTSAARHASGSIAGALDQHPRYRFRGRDILEGGLTTAAARLEGMEPDERRAAIIALGPEGRFRWIDEVVHDALRDTPGGVWPEHLRFVVSALDPESIMSLVDSLVAAGHGLAAAALLAGAVTDAPGPGGSGAVARHLSARLDAGDQTAAVTTGHILAATGDTAAVVTVLMGGAGRLGAALLEAARHPVESGTSAALLDELRTALGSIENTDLRIDVIVELMAETLQPHAEHWRSWLDGTIDHLVDGSEASIVPILESHSDPDAAVLVPWLQRQTRTAAGPGRIGALVGGAVPVGAIEPGWLAAVDAGDTFTNARTAGYLAGALSVAVRLEADNAHAKVASLGAAAAAGEILLAAVTRIGNIAEVVLPASLDIGVAGRSASVDVRIDTAMWQLLGRIDERFEPAPHPGMHDLAMAINVFDDRRDTIVRRWLP